MRHTLSWILISVLLWGISSNVAYGRKKSKKSPDISKEQLFMQTYFTEIPLREWSEGKTFVYLDTELSPLLQKSTFSTSEPQSYKGLYFVFEGLAEASPWGEGTIDILFDCEGMKFRVKTGKSLSEIQNSDYTPLLPMLVAYDEIAKANELLRGKTLYTRPAIWVDPLGNTRMGNRLFPIEIMAIEPGNTVYPMAFVFCVDSVVYRIYGSLTRTTMSQAATFDKLFTFDNPRDQYSTIPEAHWQCIMRGEVMVGMNKDECRLALGRPHRAREIPTYSGLKEEWYYNSGAYLYFEDGKLSRYRI